MDTFNNIKYREFKDHEDSMYLSADEETKPFIMSKDRFLNNTTTLNSINLSNDNLNFKDNIVDISNDHFINSYNFGRNYNQNNTSEHLLNDSLINNTKSDPLKYNLIFKYVCHIIVIIILLSFIITLIIILAK